MVGQQLGMLVRGDFPDLLTWVRRYGRDGAVLIPQPEEIWEHGQSSARQTDDGGWHIVVPLFTEEESPSELTAEIFVGPDGDATIHDVHVL